MSPEIATGTRRIEFRQVPRDGVDFISLSRPLDQNLDVVKKKMHTRFPVCKREFDTVVVIVHMKDLWPVLLTQFSNEAFRKCSLPPIFVSKSLRQDQLMKLFQSCRAHLAIVREGEGTNTGIVG